jgi:FMN phosphatase YigB (HAD superfamily)
LAGESDPARCVFFDDSPRNLAPARDLGFFTVLVGATETNPAADRSVASLLELPQALPELWLNDNHR